MKHNATPNDPHTLWDAFQKTGRISAYLAYKKALKEKGTDRNSFS